MAHLARAAAVLIALLAFAPIASAHHPMGLEFDAPGTPIGLGAGPETPEPVQLPGNPVSSKGFEFIRNIPGHIDTPGAKLLDGYFYLVTERDLTIYDVAKPEAPKRVGALDFGTDGGDFYFPEEDPETNGKILITSNAGAVEVFDVSDKKNPKFLSKLAGTAQHTISCVLDCTWAYGSEGSIVDLRDPKNPKLAGSWRTLHPTTSRHDVTEVAPGYVLTSSQPMYLLDVRADPTKPVRVAGVASANRFQHANLWPNQMTDDIVLVGGEAGGPQCAGDASATFQTYDAKDWGTTETFKLLDEFSLEAGLPTNGRNVDSTYCVHWFDPHPTYKNGGLVAIGWYEHGTRLVRIAPDGKITEEGWYLPVGASTSAVYWVSDRIAYVADYNRGLDIVKYTGPLPTAQPAPATKAKKAKGSKPKSKRSAKRSSRAARSRR